MGTRLYPNTTDPIIMEKLLHLQPGTHRRLLELQEPFTARQKARTLAFEGKVDAATAHKLRHEYEDDQFELWNLLNREENKQEGTLDNFLTYGWGRPASSLVTDYSGCEKDTERVRRILFEQGVVLPADVNVEDLDGLHWC